MKFSPVSGHIIFQIVDPPNKTASGLLISQAKEHESQWARALAVSKFASDAGVSEGDLMLVFMKGAIYNRILGKDYWGVHVSNVLSVIHVEDGDQYEVASEPVPPSILKVIEGGVS